MLSSNPSGLPPFVAVLGALTAVALSVFLYLGLPLMSYSTDYRDYFDPKNPQLQDLINIQTEYDRTDNVLFALSALDGNIFTSQHLETIAWATQEAWQAPYAVRVDSVTNFQHSQADGEGVRIAPLLNAGQPADQDTAKRIRSIALNEPLLLNRLVAPGGATAGIELSVLFPGVSAMENYEVVTFARDLAAQIAERDPQLQTHLTGLVMYDQAFFEAAMADEAKIFPIAYGLTALVMLVLTRNVIATVLTCAVAWLCRSVTLGASGWLGVKLTSLSTAAPMIVMIVCLVYAVHMTSTVLRGMERGASARDSARQAVGANAAALSIIAITTVVGFLSLSVSEVPPFRDLGYMAAIGVTCGYLLTVFVLPWCMAVLPMRVGRIAAPFGAQGLPFVTGFVTRRPSAILLVTGLALVGSVALLPTGRIDDSYSKWFSQEIPFRTANDFTSTNLTGLYSIDFDVGGSEPGALTNPDTLKEVAAFAEWLRQQPEAVYVYSVTDILKKLNRNLHGDASDYYALPTDSEAAAQYMLLYEMSLPFGLDLTNRVTVDKSRTRLTVVLRDVSTSEMLDLERRANAWLGETPGIEGIDGSVTLIFAHIGDSNARAMIWGVLGALVIISVMLALVSRSLFHGVLAVLINIAPIVIALGIWVGLGGTIGLSMAIMSGVALGIVVDGTVHFLLKYRLFRSGGQSTEEAIGNVLATTGVDIATAAIVLTVGFASLFLSVFALNRDLGLASALAIVLAFLFEVLVMPSLLLVFSARRQPDTTTTVLQEG